MAFDALEKAGSLSCWKGPVAPEPLMGGITNTNFTVVDDGEKFVVRVGSDIPEHGIMRFNELAASRGAHAAGISPEVVHAEAGAMVLRFIDGRTFTPREIRKQANLERIVPLLKRVHRQIPRYFRGAALAFWVFHVLRDYSTTLAEGKSRMAGELPRFRSMTDELEQAVGPVLMVFGHNDLLAANFIDDGHRLWLIDWDYAGYNSPLFDLGGLASNNELTTEQERWLLESYFEKPAGGGLWYRYGAMKCASLLREAMWSMVSEIHSVIDFDYAAYTEENLARFQRAYDEFKHSGGE